MQDYVRSWLILGFTLCGLGAGCGESDGLGPYIPISGTVKLGGEPLKSGDIVFSPLQVGRGVQGTIVDGAFSIPKSRGPSPGPYRVEIHSIQPTGKKVFDRGEGEMIEQTKNMVPAAYNANSKLQVEVEQSGENTFTFDLELPSKASR